MRMPNETDEHADMSSHYGPARGSSTPCIAVCAQTLVAGSRELRKRSRSRAAMRPSTLAMRRPRLSLSIATRPVESPGTTNPSARDAQAEFASSFELGEALGSGAFAVVKRARRRDDGSVLAVKCVHSDDSEHHRLVREEFDMLRSMSCTTVVSVSALYECGEAMYLCMELCSAGDVHSYVAANGPFSETCVLDENNPVVMQCPANMVKRSKEFKCECPRT
eukprot:TRINITY_DN11534_c0_g1_i1.p1 TRINITY_DN11534_c0_g1~~TRINITY_DN11534_c0_g1_i1.p1  ORF type:complete len:221 (-),score=24.78 TRINITY_DN11534_c0_g1_i1:53-715(-)